MIQETINSLSMWFFENLSNYKEICHFISTRNGGFSSSPYRSFNLSFNVGNNPEKVLKNRELLASSFKFTVDDFVTCEQIHKGNVSVVTEKNRHSEQKATDAVTTKIRRMCLMILLADCAPILFYDPQQKAIAIAHAGWSGTVNKIVENTINTMVREYNSVPENIIVGIGPSIGPCCYDVKSDVVEKVQRKLDNSEEIIVYRNKKYYLDLWKANEFQLLNSGVREENIEVARVCIQCNRKVFFSARANRGKTGRFGAGIMKL